MDLARHKRQIVDAVFELVTSVGHHFASKCVKTTVVASNDTITKKKPAKKKHKNNNSTSSPTEISVKQTESIADDKVTSAMQELQNHWGKFLASSKSSWER